MNTSYICTMFPVVRWRWQFLLAILNIINAFNTIPWDGIVEAFEFFEVPPYFVRVIQAYLNDRYLRNIGRKVTNTCHHCGEGEVTAQHTLEFCPAWEIPRHVLWLAIGESLGPSSVVDAMLRCSSRSAPIVKK